MEERIRKIDLTCVVAASSDPRRFLSSLSEDDGWVAAPRKYPTDVVLSLGSKVNVYKVIVESHQDFVPTKVEIHVGRCNWGEFKSTVDCAERASFTRRGIVEFVPQGPGNLTVEPQSCYTDSIGQFVWLVIHQNHQNSQNPENFIGLKNVTVLGYPIESLPTAISQAKEDIPLDPTMSLRDDIDDEYDEYKDRRNGNKEYRSVSRARSAASRTTRSSSSKGKRSYTEKSGYSQRNEELGEDPLTSVRTLRNVLRKKRILAEQEDRMVEASMCRRGCERLDEAEDDIMALKKKHSSALVHSDTVAADQHRQAMCDVRDAAFRAIHADLLLDRSELRTFGVKSKWGQDPSEGESRRRPPSTDHRRSASVRYKK
uniref:Centrosomal protein CEP104 N-terminal domain-containing protein n=1 Tax=Plectus sambesii TaxID=2011161 RepID=A0A914UR62_9BILA